MSMENTEEDASLTVEVGVRYQSSSTEVVLDDENDDAVVLEVSCSQPQSQFQLVVPREEKVVVSSDGVDSRLAVMSGLELEEGVLEADSAEKYIPNFKHASKCNYYSAFIHCMNSYSLIF